MGSFQDAKLTNMEVSTSDHCYILLEPMNNIRMVYAKCFKFGNAWLRESMCRQIVEDVWQSQQGESLQVKID